MQAIQAPIKPGQSGPEVINLQDALFALLERDVIRPHGARGRPAPKELQSNGCGAVQPQLFEKHV